MLPMDIRWGMETAHQGMVSCLVPLTRDTAVLLLQVHLNASANVTVGYVFNGITPRDDLKWVPAHAAFWDMTVSHRMAEAQVCQYSVRVGVLGL